MKNDLDSNMPEKTPECINFEIRDAFFRSYYTLRYRELRNWILNKIKIENPFTTSI